MSGYSGRRSGAGRRARRNRRDILVISFIVTVLFVVLFIGGLNLRKKIDSAYDEQAQIQAQLDVEEERAEGVDAYREKMTGDEAIKQAAREKLGLVEKNEIIFKSSK